MAWTCWQEMLEEELKGNSETMQDIVSNTMSEDQMKSKFNNGYGGEEGCPFTVWTTNFVYFPVCYDGAEWVGSVSRNPDGKPTRHHGGG